MNIQWFPGHMAKTRRLIQENLKLVDVVIEILDARIPYSSKNPEIDKLIQNKKCVVILNKCDLADEQVSMEWGRWYARQGIEYIFTDAIKGKGINQVKSRLKEIMQEKIERDRQKGRIFTPIKTMIVGIPNVGKSAFINKVSGKASAKTSDRPGVTRDKQWIRINKEILLLDTPGILWPKFEDEVVGLNLAATGAIKDDIMDTAEIAMKLMERLDIFYPQELAERYKIESKDKIEASKYSDESTNDNTDDCTDEYENEGQDYDERHEAEYGFGIGDENRGLKLLEQAGRNRGCIISKGEIDWHRIAAIILDEFRGGKIGRITLETPDEV